MCGVQVVGRGLGPEPVKAPARPAGGEALQGVKRSRFALEAEEQQVSRLVAAGCGRRSGTVVSTDMMRDRVACAVHVCYLAPCQHALVE